jgi:hypothetical protein
MANTWFVCIDPVDKGKPASYLDQVDFRIQVQPSDPNYKILQSGGVINWNGQPLVKWQGPFATEAQAKTAQNPKPAPNPRTAATQFVNSSVPALATVGQFLGKLNQRETWVRIVEVGVGVALIAVALAHITGAEKALGVIPVAKAAKVAKNITK